MNFSQKIVAIFLIIFVLLLSGCTTSNSAGEALRAISSTAQPTQAESALPITIIVATQKYAYSPDEKVKLAFGKVIPIPSVAEASEEKQIIGEKKPFNFSSGQQESKVSLQDNLQGNSIEPKAVLFDKESISKRENYIFEKGSPIKLTGLLSAIHFDDFENKKDEMQFFVQPSTGASYRIFFNTVPFEEIGKYIEVEGRVLGEEIAPLKFKNAIEESFSVPQTGVNPNLGEQKVAVILIKEVEFSPITVQESHDMYFNETKSGSINNYYICLLY